ncbi:hypothetical protein [Streptomyces sp. ISL-86]|uniref:hypothetical protein n=1 Tax=Streptomyces sp. ISL-86 TaxID=2819187 RepID=UPI001BE70DA7|nr:hypothetical protein [Streptomyces sp. ISL-86]MBT2456822.1 hypothetical protein [Streptomyces sp. ISL-86]
MPGLHRRERVRRSDPARFVQGQEILPVQLGKHLGGGPPGLGGNSLEHRHVRREPRLGEVPQHRLLHGPQASPNGRSTASPGPADRIQDIRLTALLAGLGRGKAHAGQSLAQGVDARRALSAAVGVTVEAAGHPRRGAVRLEGVDAVQQDGR